MRFNVIAMVALGTIGVCRSANAEWPFQAGDNIFVSPSIADINGDGSLEIVFASWDGNCYCVDMHGNQLWQVPLYDGSGFPPQLSSSPTLVDLDGQSATREVVIGSTQDLGSTEIGRLYVLSAAGGVLGTFDVPTGIKAAPLVADLENDGLLEVVFGHIKGQFTPPASLYCLGTRFLNGRLEFDQHWSVSYEGGSIQHSPSVADINGDEVLEVIVSMNGTDPEQGSLFCLNSKGQVIWPFHVSGTRVYNTPAIADFNNDGGLQVVVNPFYDDPHCLDALSGAIDWVFSATSGSHLHSPAVADLNQDGFAEAVTGSYGVDTFWGITADGGQAWSHSFRPEWTGYSSPGIADVDGDGDLEIAIGTGTPPKLGTSSMYLFDHEGKVIWQKIMPSAVYSSPALADLDGDGFLEIAFGCYDHKFYVLDHQGNTFVPNPNTKPKDLAPWPTYRQNNQRTGFYPGPPKAKPIPGDITGDGNVNVDDLLAVINSWGECPPACPPDIAPAPKGNGNVDVDDLLMVINNWG